MTETPPNQITMTRWPGAQIPSQPDAVEATPGEQLVLDEAFVPLSANYLKLQRITDTISYAVIWVISLGLAVPGVVMSWAGAWWWGPMVVVGFPVLWLWSVWWYHPRAVEASGWFLRDNVLVKRQGVMWKSIAFLPVSRIQHVDYKSGPIEGKFDLATLEAHTAGSGVSSISIEGLTRTQAHQLRDELLKQAERLRRDTQDQSAGATREKLAT